jgi:hypothetical protein
MCYNNSSAVEVCVLHSRPRTPLRSAPVPFCGTPRNCLTPQRPIFRSHHNLVGFVRSVMIVDVPLNIHESGKCAVRKQFMFSGHLTAEQALTLWHTQPPVRQSEPSMSLLLVLAFCQQMA